MIDYNNDDLPIDPSGVPLVPGDPDNCPGNGKGNFTLEDGTEIECCCDNCDYFLKCFPKWQNPDYDGNEE